MVGFGLLLVFHYSNQLFNAYEGPDLLATLLPALQLASSCLNVAGVPILINLISDIILPLSFCLPFTLPALTLLSYSSLSFG